MPSTRAPACRAHVRVQAPPRGSFQGRAHTPPEQPGLHAVGSPARATCHPHTNARPCGGWRVSARVRASQARRPGPGAGRRAALQPGRACAAAAAARRPAAAAAAPAAPAAARPGARARSARRVLLDSHRQTQWDRPCLALVTLHTACLTQRRWQYCPRTMKCITITRSRPDTLHFCPKRVHMTKGLSGCRSSAAQSSWQVWPRAAPLPAGASRAAAAARAPACAARQAWRARRARPAAPAGGAPAAAAAPAAASAARQASQATGDRHAGRQHGLRHRSQAATLRAWRAPEDWPAGQRQVLRRRPRLGRARPARARSRWRAGRAAPRWRARGRAPPAGRACGPQRQAVLLSCEGVLQCTSCRLCDEL